MTPRQVGQVGVLRDVLAVDGPGDAIAQADLQGHIPARQLLEHFFVQLGAAGREFDLHGAAVLSGLDLVRGLLAGGLGGGTAAAAVLFHGEGSRDSRVNIVSAGNSDVLTVCTHGQSCLGLHREGGCAVGFDGGATVGKAVPAVMMKSLAVGSVTVTCWLPVLVIVTI